MDIHFNCPHCGQHLSVEGRGAGITVNCPACKGEIEIPRGSTPPPLPKLSVPTKPSQKKARHNWRDDPATQSQKDCLKRMGITINEGLTKGEASDLIGGAKAEPLYSETQQKIREAKYEEQNPNTISILSS